MFLIGKEKVNLTSFLIRIKEVGDLQYSLQYATPEELRFLCSKCGLNYVGDKSLICKRLESKLFNIKVPKEPEKHQFEGTTEPKVVSETVIIFEENKPENAENVSQNEPETLNISTENSMKIAQKAPENEVSEKAESEVKTEPKTTQKRTRKTSKRASKSEKS